MASTERLADDRVQRYLDTKEVVTLATLGADGAPRGMAMWFLHTPDAILMLSVANLQKERDLRRDPRVAVVAESVGADNAIRGVTVRGPRGVPRRVAGEEGAGRSVPRQVPPAPRAPLGRPHDAHQPGDVQDRPQPRA